MLGAIVALSLFIVLITANRPSLLAPTTHTGFYPHWMSGPLGGLLPGLTGNSTTLRFMFTGAIVVMFVAYVWVLRCAPRVPVGWVVAAIVLVHAIFLISPPLALTDMFNYINYGRMEVVHHLNPYTTIPVLEPHSDPSYALSNWHELLSPYGPLFTLLTFAVVPLGVAGVLLGAEGDPRGGQPGDHPAGVEVRPAARPRAGRRDRAGGAEPDRARVGAGRRPQRLPDDPLHHGRLLPAAAQPGLRAGAGGAAAAARGCRRAARGWLLPLSAAQVGAGSAFVLAAAHQGLGRRS